MRGWSRRARLAAICSLAALAGADLVGFLSGEKHYGGFWNSVPLGDVAIGGLGGVALFWFARRVLKRLLSRDETYYDGGGRP